MSLYTHQNANIWKTWLLMAVFFAFIIGVGYATSLYYGDPSIFYIAFVISILLNITSFWYSDKIALSISGAKEASFSEYPELHRITENLAITAGLPKPRVYVIKDMSPNAFATGRDKEHAAIAVTEGLLQILDRSELEGVIAHELAHIGNRDILLSTVVVVLVGLVTLLADFSLRFAGFGNKNSDSKVHPIIGIIAVILMILSPIIATIIQLAISRKREFLADATGALITRYPEGLAHALSKISAHPVPLRRANHATAHLYFSNPFADEHKKPGFLTKLFMTHPPAPERIAALLGQVK